MLNMSIKQTIFLAQTRHFGKVRYTPPPKYAAVTRLWLAHRFNAETEIRIALCARAKPLLLLKIDRNIHKTITAYQLITSLQNAPEG